MKFVKLLTAGFISAFLLSSCLGDSDFKQSYQGIFAYKGKDLSNGYQSVLRIPANGGMQVTFEGIDSKLEDGDCAEVSLSISNASNGAINIADNVVIDKIYKAREQAITYNGAPSKEREEVYPSSFNIGMSYGDEFLGDRWKFTANTRTDEPSSNVLVEFYYDRDNQRVYVEDEDGKVITNEACDKNQIVIDVRFYKTDESVSNGALLEVSKDKNSHTFVGNLRDVRRLIESEGILDPEAAEGQNYTDLYYVYVPVMFRYNQQKDKDKPMLSTYKGKFEIGNSSSSDVFYTFAFPKD